LPSALIHTMITLTAKQSICGLQLAEASHRLTHHRRQWSFCRTLQHLEVASLLPMARFRSPRIPPWRCMRGTKYLGTPLRRQPGLFYLEIVLAILTSAPLPIGYINRQLETILSRFRLMV